MAKHETVSVEEGPERDAPDAAFEEGRSAAGAGVGGDADAAPQGSGENGDADAVELDVAELLEKAAQRDEYLALAQRTQADFENYRKRVARDAAAAELRGTARLASALLAPIDNLDRAIEAAGGAEEQLLEGLRLVQRELHAALERAGIESFSPVGEPFDPALHEAVAQQPFEGVEPGRVVEVYQSGYRLDGNVLRPARVLVAG